MNQQGNQIVEIDVLYLLKKMWGKKVFVAFTAILFGVLSLIFTVFVVQPKYTSTTRIYVANNTTDGVTAQDLQVGGYLVNDYREIITSRDVLSEVIASDAPTMTPGQLAGMLSISVPTDTRIISISVNSDSPQRAQKIANRIREVASAKIKAVTQVDDVTTLEEAQLPSDPSSPNVERNVFLVAVFGGGLAVMFVLLREVLDDRVKRPEDVEEVLGMTLIGVVPDVTKM
ncbi:capsular biosynthesis protein CpsC [Streptococcus sp. X16XC17]|uniref:Wzz/FepE/Etk N-terminal domain-containing protein n=1 Tax=unclassified Streptococcus TaxID=2608887 RepID=UPI00066FDED3|nr:MULTISPECIES: Wzz/FepE/Etk N-terminal domain-containing protein [unclassified Streptococcus]TCD46258.1 capsular biosynthesis protein CpsC [Streptococcus sp. X16XC17]